MVHVEHVLSVVAVSDITTANAWYSTLFGRHADNSPMPNLLEWRVTDSGWVQVTEDQRRAGDSMLNLAVSDIEEGAQELREMGLAPGEIIEANKGVRLCPLRDPDGNAIHIVGNFRVKY